MNTITLNKLDEWSILHNRAINFDLKPKLRQAFKNQIKFSMVLESRY